MKHYQPPFEGPVIGFPKKKESPIWKVCTIALLCALWFQHIRANDAIHRREEALDAALELLKEVTTPPPAAKPERRPYDTGKNII